MTDADAKKAFFQAIEDGDIKTVSESMAKHPDFISAKDEDGYTPLGRATEIFRLFPPTGMTEKDYYNNKKEIIAFLVNNGANLETTPDDIQGYITPLGHAAKNPKAIDIMKLLIKKGAKVDNASEEYRPLMLAAEGGHIEGIKLLLENGAKLQGAELAEAAMFDNPKTVQFLLDLDKDKKIFTPDRINTAMLNALDRINHNYGTLDALIKAGADVKYKGAEGETILHQFVERHMGERTDANALTHGIEKAVSLGADINAVDNKGNTPLHEAIENTSYSAIFAKKDLDMAAALIEEGAKLNIRNKAGKTALDLMKEHFTTPEEQKAIGAALEKAIKKSASLKDTSTPGQDIDLVFDFDKVLARYTNAAPAMGFAEGSNYTPPTPKKTKKLAYS